MTKSHPKKLAPLELDSYPIVITEMAPNGSVYSKPTSVRNTFFEDGVRKPFSIFPGTDKAVGKWSYPNLSLKSLGVEFSIPTHSYFPVGGDLYTSKWVDLFYLILAEESPLDFFTLCYRVEEYNQVLPTEESYVEEGLTWMIEQGLVEVCLQDRL
jgi:hypothetical protein